MNRDDSLRRQINPRETSNVLSVLSFFYSIELFTKGYRSGLETEDIYEVLSSCRSQDSGDLIEKQWKIEEKRSLNPSICRALWACFGKTFILIGLMQFTMKIIVTIWSPEALSKLISYFSPGQTNLTKQGAIYYACLFIGLKFLNLFVRYNYWMVVVKLVLRAKQAIASLLYRKSLKLSYESLSEVTAGKIITVVTKDVDAIEMFGSSGNDTWIALVQAIVICYLIYQKIGIASFAGVAFFLIVLPLQGFMGIMSYNYRLKCSKKTDERLELIQEILSAIKIIKMYTWESVFQNKIGAARKEELKQLHKLFYTKVGIVILGSICSKIAFFIFLMTYVWMGNNVTAEIVFYILSCFTDLESSLSHTIPFGLSYMAELYATAKRIESVLMAKERPSKQEYKILSKNPKIIFNSVTVTVCNTTVFEKVSLTVNQGLNIVMGNVGTGKTTFLKAILQDCQMTGNINISGRISYASQEPWLFPSSIQNNILFGEEYRAKRYQEVLRICNLIYDLDLLPDGDSTIIGDRGINLSKGQQARVNLARAVYKDSDIYLLDDSLASLDAHVSDNIFEECICKFLKDKLCIFVTNNSDYVQRANKVMMTEGTSIKFIKKLETKFSRNVIMNTINQETMNNKDVVTKKQLYQEVKRSGKVRLKDYRKYIRHGGGIFVFGIVVALFIGSQSVGSYSDKVLSKWITLEQNLSNYKQLNQTHTPKYQNLYKQRTYELTVYTIVITTSIILAVIRSFAFFYFTRMASINMHKAMVNNIINSTMKFFESFFIGNILTRFSKDCLTIDETLPFDISECLWFIFIGIGGVILLTTVSSLFLLESLIFLVIACVIKQFCQPAGRNLERLHIIARSPLLGHLNATLEGLTTIRASNAEEIVAKEFDRHQDVYISAHYMVYTCFTALGFGLELLCVFFISLLVLQFLVINLGASVGDVGLAITQSVIISGIVTSGLRSVADCENLMISVERILEFTELEEEDKNGSILIGWPKDGHVEFSEVSLDYSKSSKKILSDINFVVKPNEKLGIVGRTGAGKSSIISLLFRLYPMNGNIFVDGTDIQNVSLNWLRSKISVIPQDPYLFSGTIRENLDPLGQCRDEQIWKVLAELRLKNFIDDINMKVDKGSSLSAGQKQLLCLARAILRKNRIVVLDEITANVDQETDVLIQEAVKKNFCECTVIIVAHRLLTVMSCQKVIVLNNGKISEFDEPVKLMQNKNSFFNSIIK